MALTFSPDTKFLAAGQLNGDVQIWQTNSWHPLPLLHVKGALNALAFNKDSHVLAVAARSLTLWRTSDTSIWKFWKQLGPAGNVYGAAQFAPSGSQLATVDSAEEIELWNIATGAKLQTLCCMALYGEIAFSPDSLVLAAAGHWPRLWNLATGNEIYRLVRDRNPTFASISFRSDGKQIATGSQDGIARIWSVSNGSQLLRSHPRQDYIESVAFQPAGTCLAYRVRNGPVWLWNLTTQAEQSIPVISTSNVVFSPDGDWLSVGTRGAVQIWNRTLQKHIELKFPASSNP